METIDSSQPTSGHLFLGGGRSNQKPKIPGHAKTLENILKSQRTVSPDRHGNSATTLN